MRADLMNTKEQLRSLGFPCEGLHSGFLPFFTAERLTQLADIAALIREKAFFPRAEYVLRFVETDPAALRCVIVGMDPYPSHTVGPAGEIVPEATGRSFEVASVTDWGGKYRQASLRNILKAIYFKERGRVPTMEDLRTELSDGDFPILPPRKWWESLTGQGVLFLNASLTVRPAEPGSHTDLWDGFVTDLMTFLAQSSPDAVWLLWGNVAQARVPAAVTRKICSSHPRLPQFVTECPFAQLPGINWLG